MNRRVIFLCVVLMISTVGLWAGAYDDIYTLNLPYQYQSLTIDGASATNGAHAFDLQLTTSPVSFSIEAGLGADWEYVKNEGPAFLWMTTSGTRAQVGDSGIGFAAAVDGMYRNYAFELEGMDAFLSASGDATVTMNLSFSPVNANFFALINPEIGFGVGRMYSIQNTREIINTMEHFNIPVTPEKVREVAEHDFMRTAKFNTYTNDLSKIVSDFYQERADILGMGDRALELIYVGNSQEYAFEQNRWAGLLYGWTTYMEVRPWLWYATGSTTEFRMDLALVGEYATLLNDDTLYARGYVDIVPGITTSGTDFFTFESNLTVDARYFFTDPRMWADGTVDITINSQATKVFDLDIDAEFNYQINPNFIAFAGAEIQNTFGTMAIYAGGEMRLF